MSTQNDVIFCPNITFPSLFTFTLTLHHHHYPHLPPLPFITTTTTPLPLPSPSTTLSHSHPLPPLLPSFILTLHYHHHPSLTLTLHHYCHPTFTINLIIVFTRLSLSPFTTILNSHLLSYSLSHPNFSFHHSSTHHHCHKTYPFQVLSCTPIKKAIYLFFLTPSPISHLVYAKHTLATYYLLFCFVLFNLMNT